MTVQKKNSNHIIIVFNKNTYISTNTCFKVIIMNTLIHFFLWGECVEAFTVKTINTQDVAVDCRQLVKQFRGKLKTEISQTEYQSLPTETLFHWKLNFKIKILDTRVKCRSKYHPRL